MDCPRFHNELKGDLEDDHWYYKKTADDGRLSVVGGLLSIFVYAFLERFQMKPIKKNRVAVNTMAEPETILK